MSASPAKSAQGAESGAADSATIAAKDTEIGRLNMLVKQRDNEIGILLNYLNKQKAAGDDNPSLPVEGAAMHSVGNSTQYSNASASRVTSTNATIEENKQA